MWGNIQSAVTFFNRTGRNYLPKGLAVSGFFCIFASYLKIVL